MATNTPAVLFRGNLALGTTPVRAYVSNQAITSNLSTITTNAVHGITQVGTTVSLSGVTSVQDGFYTIHSIPTTTTFTYVSTTATVASAAVSPVGIASFTGPMTSGVVVTNKVVQNYLATLTAASHGLAVGDLIAVTLGDASTDTTGTQVTAVPSANTFSYKSATQTTATAAVSQGSFGKFSPLYTVPASTTTIITNIIVSNNSNASATFNLIVDGIALAQTQTIAANSSAYFDLKQTMATTKTIVGSASTQFVSCQISGMTVV